MYDPEVKSFRWTGKTEANTTLFTPLPRYTHSLTPLYSQKQTSEDEERLLLTEPAMTAYLSAEVHAWLLLQDDFEKNNADMIAAGAGESFKLASNLGILSHHGALISFMQTELRENEAFAESSSKITPYTVAKQCVDVLHHRLYRGTYTKTAEVLGVGDNAARKAVGLEEMSKDDEDDEDGCLVVAPEEIESDCLWTESEEAAFRVKRFERINMEGFRDPRRGNNGLRH